MQCFGATMGGALFGNVCSPISDTTILTSLATRVPLATHVRTLFPYAGLVGIVSLIFGDLACGLGVPSGVALGMCTLALALAQWILSRTGKRVEQNVEVPPATGAAEA
jgi:Na+/H+ antiporter NhaC